MHHCCTVEFINLDLGTIEVLVISGISLTLPSDHFFVIHTLSTFCGVMLTCSDYIKADTIRRMLEDEASVSGVSAEHMAATVCAQHLCSLLANTPTDALMLLPQQRVKHCSGFKPITFAYISLVMSVP